jgi:hypothetical protein
MSKWTHVAGCIRIDELPPDNPKFHLLIQEKIAARFASPPIGSEGPICYHVVQTGDDNSVAWGLVYIYGDLRDFEDSKVHGIFTWLQNACKGLLIRSCCVKVDVEYGPTYLVTDSGDDQLTISLIPSMENKPC